VAGVRIGLGRAGRIAEKEPHAGVCFARDKRKADFGTTLRYRSQLVNLPFTVRPDGTAPLIGSTTPSRPEPNGYCSSRIDIFLSFVSVRRVLGLGDGELRLAAGAMGTGRRQADLRHYRNQEIGRGAGCASFTANRVCARR